MANQELMQQVLVTLGGVVFTSRPLTAAELELTKHWLAVHLPYNVVTVVDAEANHG